MVYGNLKKFVYSNIGSTFAFAIGTFDFFVRLARGFQKERDQFIIVFSNISDKHVSEQLHQVENLQDILAKTKEKSSGNVKQKTSVVSKPVVSSKRIERVPNLLDLSLGGF